MCLMYGIVAVKIVGRKLLVTAKKGMELFGFVMMELLLNIVIQPKIWVSF